jgi:hypothetical protein
MSLISFDGKWINNLYEYGTTTHTGNTNNTILESVVVPANTYRTGDIIMLDSMFDKSGTAGIWTLRFYWVAGNTPTLSGAIQLSLRSIGSTNQFATQNRRLYIRTADGTGSGFTLGTEVITAGSGIYNDYRSEAVSNLALDWTSVSCIFSTVQLGNSTDRVTQYYLKIWEW